MSSSTVVALLEELSLGLESNASHLEVLLELMQAVVSEEQPDTEKVKTLLQLSDKYPTFVKSLSDLRDNQTSIIESYNTKVKLSPFADVAKSSLSIKGSDGSADALLTYINELKTLDDLCFEHVNLLGRLSSNLGTHIGPSDSGTSSLEEDNGQPSEIKKLLEKYDLVDDQNEEPEVLRQRLLNYIDSMKMEKARYSLVNQYMLNDLYQQLTKEVTQWRQQYESLEGIMFGDNPNSIRTMLYKIENLKKRLGKYPDHNANEDVEMN